MRSYQHAYICDGTRTPFGRYGGSLSTIRPDDLAAHVIRAIVERNPDMDVGEIDDVILGNANQAGECNRNIARMSVLLAGLCDTVPGTTINRLCGSGLDAIGTAARAIRAGDAQMMIAGGAESMSRAPFVMAKAPQAFSRQVEVYDTTIGWRFVNKLMEQQFGIESMPQTAENVAEEFNISRADQDGFALRSQHRTAAAQNNGRLAQEITAISIPQRKGDPIIVDKDEHPRETTLDALAALPTPFRAGGTVTAGNASGINDGAAALIIASEGAIKRHNLTPKARIMGMSAVGVPPRIMGIGPAPASEKLLQHLGISIGEVDLIELNEAFAAQALATLRKLGLPDDAKHVNPNGGAIALGHPLGASGARLALTAAHEMQLNKYRYGLCTMCIGVGQGIAMMLERV